MKVEPFEVICIDAWKVWPGRDAEQYPQFLKHYQVIGKTEKDGGIYYFLQGYPKKVVFNSKGFKNAGPVQ